MIRGDFRVRIAAWLIQHYEFFANFVPCTPECTLCSSLIAIKCRKLSISY